MRPLLLVRQFLDELRSQKLRSALTIMGIAWGTVAVVVLLAFGVGLEAQMRKNAAGIGENVIILFPGRTTQSFQGFPDGRHIRMEERDVGLITGEVSGISLISPEYGRWNPVRYDERTSNSYVTGVEPDYGELRNVFPAAGGRFLNVHDIDGRRRVAVLGDKLKERLFGDADAIGDQVFIGETPFTIVGVMAAKTQNSSYQSRDEDRVFIPTSTFQSVYGIKNIERIVYRLDDPTASEAVQAEIRMALARKHRFSPADEDAIRFWDTSEQMKFFRFLFLGFNLFLGVVGSFTLVVGGIGVANIMYIVVRERTREIGIRRAMGARRTDILGQVLLETGLIVAVGAMLGFGLAVALVSAAGMFPIEEYIGAPRLSTLVLGTTLSLLGAIAFLAGLFPARRAANLDPVESLRYGV
jgi:putative ABC transport system permease protein